MEGEANSNAGRPDQIRPVRRVYRPGSGRRDVDAIDKVVRLRVFLWSLVGALLGFFLGVFAAVQGASPWIILPTTLMGMAGTYVGPLVIIHMAGRVGSSVYAPTGSSTPRAKEYSLAESFIVRGMYDEATVAFQDAIEDDPLDWQPYVRIARMRRDRASDAEGAALWFRRAVTEAVIPSGPRLLVLKEYVELCQLRLGTPEKAAPILARVAELEADTAEGRWAAETLIDIKRVMAEGDEGDAPE